MVYREVTYDVGATGRRLVSCQPLNPTPGGCLTVLTPYSECLERVRSVLVFFAATGKANAAVLAELESEVRATVSASRLAYVAIDDVYADLERLATITLPEVAAASASRMMRGWAEVATANPSAAPPREIPHRLP
jgi:hypothetical protein